MVAGIRTPKNISEMSDWKVEIYEQLIETKRILEDHYREMQDIEFTIEHGKLYILQTRTGKRTGLAAVKIAADMFTEGHITRGDAWYAFQQMI